jgi:hypothetical protein
MTEEEKIEREKKRTADAQLLSQNYLLKEFLEETDAMCFAAMKSVQPGGEEKLMHYAMLAQANDRLRQKLQRCAERKFKEKEDHILEPLGNIHG